MNRKRAMVGLLLFLSAACAFYGSRVHYVSDSRFSLLMDEAILRYGTPNMIRYQVPRGEGSAFTNHGYLWTMDTVKGRLLYVFPWGGALLTLPAVAVFNVSGFTAAPDGVYNENNEMKMQAILAALLCALTVWVFYEIACSMLPLGWALAIALGSAFGTQMWSSASRSLWPQTWYVLLIALAIWILTSKKARPILLGSLLAWACFARPGAPPIVGIISVYVFLEYGLAFFVRYAGEGASWTAIFAGSMMYFEGVPFAVVYPMSYFAFRHDFLLRLIGVLFSPSRGLFIFVPILFFPLYLIFRCWRDFPRRRLAVLAIAVIVLHIVIISIYGPWWGGGSYGPRDLLDAIPWFVLLTALGLKAFLEERQLSMPECSAVISVALLLLVLSVAMTGVGALSTAAALEWNQNPPIDSHLDRLWDWQHPQFLAWLQQ